VRQRLLDKLREASTREILAAAEAELSESGVERATMAAIAERAGVAVGTLYNRFKDRDALVAALIVERRSELLEKLDANLASLRSGGVREQLTGFFTALISHIEEHRPFLRLVIEREVRLDEGRAEMSKALLERVERILARGYRQRLLRKDAEGIFAPCLLGAAKGLLFHDAPSEPPEALARSLVSLFLEGAGRVA
jgi:AcrR family transcriptional regulator